jgi:hypothetical protein
MTLAKRFWLISACAIIVVLGAAQWFQAKPAHAQQSADAEDDGYVYVYAAIDVDSNYYLYTDSYTELEDNNLDEFLAVDDEIQVEQDNAVFFDDFADSDPVFSEYPSLTSSDPVSVGHEYGVQSIGYVCINVETDGEEDGYCDWSVDNVAYASVDIPSPPPAISAVMPGSAYQGQQGTLTVNGSNFVNYGSEPLVLHLSGGGSPFTQTASSSPCTTSCTASFLFDFTGYSPGTYNLWISNNESASEPVQFTIYSGNGNASAPPADPCAVTSNSQIGFTSVVPTGTPGGSGTMGISFSGAAFAAVNASVTYGPYSTPESIASNIAALVTKIYFNKGLSAKAFGPYVVYSGNTTLGTVNNVATGPSYGNDGSAGAAASAACYAAQPSHYYRLEYKAYIPVDNIPGPTPCNPFIDPSSSPGLDYLGDGSSFSATGYRILETAYASINLLSSAPQGPVVPLTGKTVNFATPFYTLIGGGPLATISGGQWLEPTPKSMTAVPGTFSWEHGCNAPLENEFGFATTTGIGGATTTYTASTITTEFTGLKNDPLEPQVPGAGINWDLKIAIDSSSNTATVTGWNTCYPAQQIRVNGVLIYDSQPLTSTTAYLGACLTHVNAVRNVNNCTNIPLNTSRPCTPQ